jgi:hypothetical protein
MGPERQSYWQCKEQRLYHSEFLLFKRQVEGGLGHLPKGMVNCLQSILN